MSFLELFGGSWTNKTAPSSEDLQKRSEIMNKQQVPKEVLEKLKEDMTKAGAGQPTVTIKQVEGVETGLYSFSILIGGTQVHEMKFRIDGTAVTNKREMDGKEYQCTGSFENGIWTTKITSEGSPDVTMIRKRVEDEITVTETCDEICINEVAVKVSA